MKETTYLKCDKYLVFDDYCQKDSLIVSSFLRRFWWYMCSYYHYAKTNQSYRQTSSAFALRNGQ